MTAATTARRRAAERRGRRAERLCVLRLILTGWRVLARRHTGPRGTGLGEIDIVAKRGQMIAFIEVKTRPRREAGLIAIGASQRRRIGRAAMAYLARHPNLSHCTARFDVMIVGSGLWPYRLVNAWEMDAA